MNDEPREDRMVVYRRVADLEPHPLGNIIPVMSGGEWSSFIADIRERGITEPLQLAADGKTVLDGRHRLRAAKDLRLETVPTIPAQLGELTDKDFMYRAALMRRNLNESQRAILGHRLRELWSEELKHERAQTANQARLSSYADDKQKEPPGLESLTTKVGTFRVITGGGNHPPRAREELAAEERRKAAWLNENGQERTPQSTEETVSIRKRDARQEAAKTMNVSVHRLDDVRKLEQSAPDLLTKVEQGTLNLSEAKREEWRRREKPEKIASEEDVKRAAHEAYLHTLGLRQFLKVLAPAVPSESARNLDHLHQALLDQLKLLSRILPEGPATDNSVEEESVGRNTLPVDTPPVVKLRNHTHPTVFLSPPWGVPIDVEIAPLVQECWRLGLRTTNCCQGDDIDLSAPVAPGYLADFAYIAFENPGDTVRFIEMCGTLSWGRGETEDYRRKTRWMNISSSVRFPHGDIPLALGALKSIATPGSGEQGAS